MTRNVKAAAASLVVLFGAGIAPGLAEAADLKPVRALIPVRIIDESYSPINVAKYLGYFEEEGLDVTLQAVGGSNEAAIQISAGNGDIGAASPAQALIGMQSATNMAIQYFYNMNYGNIWSISVPPDSPIQSISELQGKKIGVASMGSAGVTFGKAFVSRAGLNAERDVSFLSIGNGAQAVTAVRQKAVDALAFWDAALAKFEVVGMEMRELPVDPILASLPDVSLLARPETIKNDPQMIEGFARAVAKGYDFTINNPEAAVAISWKMFPEAKPQGMSDADATAGGVKVIERRMNIWKPTGPEGMHGYFQDKDWAQLVRFMMDEGLMTEEVPTSRIFTNDFIEAINTYDREAVIASAKAFDQQSMK
ncbi:ABC transporter substrate-binding protein [Telmatospirillum sp. J64-1]|uniref:ABC transporter substrate-binding protein n=1 Tax=Telmatospirillum sp. J64-1 TaxID=2502183 RepID=UPI00163D45A6|nr:ABC transporter substrate-binding protein [Telmatospirillum sp. J64-1]